METGHITKRIEIGFAKESANDHVRQLALDRRELSRKSFFLDGLFISY